VFTIQGHCIEDFCEMVACQKLTEERERERERERESLCI
jgi:hypothetical protein